MYLCISAIQSASGLIYRIAAEEPTRMTIIIPTPLRVYAGGRDAVEVDAATVADALQALTQAHPDLRNHLFTPEGKVRAFVNLYLNDEDVRYLSAREATTVTAADTLSIIPSIAGGD
ncbi:MAG TPA: MoaD/ThiS family protein [Terracidiphilus sp.]|nr:MoaD/ThiS family protein [Terracidiphilus sp.]